MIQCVGLQVTVILRSSKLLTDLELMKAARREKCKLFAEVRQIFQVSIAWIFDVTTISYLPRTISIGFEPTNGGMK